MLTPTKYNDWGALIAAAWHYGLNNMTSEVLEWAIEELSKDLRSSFLEPAHEPAVRPSGNINCAAKPWLITRGLAEPEELTGIKRLLFATGHFHHNLLYAAMKVALPPEDFQIVPEEEIPLPYWFHQDRAEYKKVGHIDLQFGAKCTNGDWFEDHVPEFMLVDVKTKHSMGMGQLKGAITASNDIYGNIDQLAVYNKVLAERGEKVNGATLVYVNREVPSAYAKTRAIDSRFVLQEDLDEAFANVTRRIDPDAEFDPELWLREDLKWKPCEKYCDLSKACEAEREKMDV